MSLSVFTPEDALGSEGPGATGEAEWTRRRMTAKQAAAVERLVEAAGDEARERGYEATTVRSAAKRAGVAPATAYTYFASKDHLLSEVLWRRMNALAPLSHDPDASPLERAGAELRSLALFIADDERLAAACTTALLGTGPEVRYLRIRFGAEVHRRLTEALGDMADTSVLRSLDLAYSGAMLWAGMGHMPFSEVPDALGDLARLLLAEKR